MISNATGSAFIVRVLLVDRDPPAAIETLPNPVKHGVVEPGPSQIRSILVQFLKLWHGMNGIVSDNANTIRESELLQ
jgi:hypothetical protein